MAHPPRIREFDYRGPIAVCFTISTLHRRRAFECAAVADFVVTQLLHFADRFDVEGTAYCVMPDHVHVLLTGVTDNAAPVIAIERWKQKTGYWFSRERRALLWQPGYWDRVLRDEDNVMQAVGYIVANPLRAGLVTNLDDYPWLGSSRCSRRELAHLCQSIERPSWW